MNEQLQELASQAKFMAEEEINRQISYNAELQAFAEKFAGLIVREMCQVIDADCQLQMRQRVITNLGGLNQARELIKKHFGVKQ